MAEIYGYYIDVEKLEQKAADEDIEYLDACVDFINDIINSVHTERLGLTVKQKAWLERIEKSFPDKDYI